MPVPIKSFIRTQPLACLGIARGCFCITVEGVRSWERLSGAQRRISSGPLQRTFASPANWSVWGGRDGLTGLDVTGAEKSIKKNSEICKDEFQNFALGYFW